MNNKLVVSSVAAAIALAISTHTFAATCDSASSSTTVTPVDISQPSYATSSSNAWVYTDKYEYFPDMASKAFDGIASSSHHWTENTYWRPRNQNNEWLAQTFPRPKRISGYTVKAAHQTMAPEHWQLQGSNNGTDWVILDVQQDIEFSPNEDKLTYEISTEKQAEYTHYRFYFRSNSKAIGVSEIELFEAEVCEPTPPPVTDISSVVTYEFERPWYEESRKGTHSWYTNLDYALTYNGQLKFYDQLESGVITGDPSINILQMDSGLPDYPGISGGLDSGGHWHSNAVAKILYSCLDDDGFSYRYLQGCQIDSDKSAVSSYEFRSRNIEYHNQPLEQFANEVFNGSSPDIMAMAVANPTTISRKSTIHGLRVGDFIFDAFDILAISAQPGSYTDTNATLGGNYYNAIVVGKTLAGINYSTVAEIDSNAGARFKPDIVTTTNNGGMSSSWSVPAVASFASKMLAVAAHNPHLADINHPEAAKAVIMAGAHKQGLTKSENPSVEDSPIVPHVWSNTTDKPLDRIFGAGQFNQGNSYQIFDSGQQHAGISNQKQTGWDTTEISGNGNTLSYHFTLDESSPEFSTILTWNRKLTVENEEYSSHMADLSLALYRVDAQGGAQLVATSDDTANNVEHIFINSGLDAGTYQLRVTLKDDAGLDKVRYGIAWQSRDNWTADAIW